MSNASKYLKNKRVLFESLERRRMLSSTPWGTQSVLIHQNQAVSQYPWITGAGETIAILDTGADYNMPVLGGGFGPGYKVIAGYNYINNTGDPMDDDGHGTGNTGLAAGDMFTYTDYATGMTAQFMGVAPGVNVVVVAYDNGGFGTQTQDLLGDALDWVVANRATYNIVAVNISNGFGNYSSPYVSPIFGADLQTLADDGVFIAAASGNSGTQYPSEVESPAADPNVYGVGSVDLDGQISSFTQAGSMLNFLAPGNDITLPYLNNVTLDPVFLDTASGTSFSTPQVTGAAALLYQIDPNFTPAQIAQILTETGTSVYDSATNASYPLINLDAAITQAYITASQPYGIDNTLATATPITFDSNGVASWSNLALLVHNDDYYSFTLSSATQVQFNLSSTGSTTPPFSLENSGGGVITGLSDGQLVTLQAGTYYMHVTASDTSSLNGTYSFIITEIGAAQSTGNNSLGSALPISLSSGQGSIVDQELLSGQSDYYSFVLDTGSDTNVTLSYSGSDGPPTAQLLNSSGSAIASFSSGQYNGALDSGTYYVEVSYGTTLDSTFSLSVDATPFPTQNPGTVGAGGVASSAAYGSNGTLYMAWFDQQTQTLEFAQRPSGGSWSTPQQVDPETGAGGDFSLAVGPDNTVAIAYYNAENVQLRYAVLSGSSWTIQNVDSSLGAGVDPSLTFSSDGHPGISYYNKRNHSLYFATTRHANWTITVVDSSANVGQNSDIAYNTASDYFAIAYDDSTHGYFKYAAQNSSRWAVTTVDNTTKSGGSGISLAFNHSNLPAFSYYDAFDSFLKFAQLGSNGVWSVSTITTRKVQGLYTNLSFLRHGAPYILYYDRSSDAVFSATPSGRSWTLTDVLDDGGDYLTVADSPLGGQTLIFYDGSSNLSVDDI